MQCCAGQSHPTLSNNPLAQCICSETQSTGHSETITPGSSWVTLFRTEILTTDISDVGLGGSGHCLTAGKADGLLCRGRPASQAGLYIHSTPRSGQNCSTDISWATTAASAPVKLSSASCPHLPFYPAERVWPNPPPSLLPCARNIRAQHGEESPGSAPPAVCLPAQVFTLCLSPGDLSP